MLLFIKKCLTERVTIMKVKRFLALPPSIDKLIKEFISSNGELTVFGDERYPQYLQYDAENDTITPLTAEEESPAKNDLIKAFDNFIRFIKAFFNFIAMLFKK